MTTTRMAITTEAEELRRWLLGQEFLGLRPLDVELRIEEDLRDEEMLIILVTLPSPEPGDTWSVDAMGEMRLAVRDKALDLGLSWPWHVRMRPADEEPLADDDLEAVPQPQPR